MPSLINLKEISKVYGREEATTYALREIDLSIDRGEFVSIMGSSGSGKSTAMNIIGCLDTPTSGSYRFEGVDVNALDRNQKALLRRHYIGFVFQGFNLLGRTSALENVELPLIYRQLPPTKRRKMALEALEKVGLEQVVHHTPAQLSGGQQQRVAIARAIVTNPLLLLADEPTGNLDSIKSQEIMELLKRINEHNGITIVMVTHEAEMAAFTHRRIYFRDGEVQSRFEKGNR